MKQVDLIQLKLKAISRVTLLASMSLLTAIACGEGFSRQSSADDVQVLNISMTKKRRDRDLPTADLSRLMRPKYSEQSNTESKSKFQFRSFVNSLSPQRI